MPRVRMVRPDDLPHIQAEHDAQNLRDGTDYPLPDLLTDGVPVALVTVNEDDTPRRCVYFELLAEMGFAGGSPEDTAELRSHIEAVAYILRSRGITGIQCQVPKQLLPSGKRPGPIERALKWAGFVRDDHRLGHFFKDLRREP